jgi:hypothetical protein
MSQMVAGEDTLNGGKGRQRTDAEMIQKGTDRQSSTRQAVVIKMESLEDNDLMDFGGGKSLFGHRHQRKWTGGDPRPGKISLRDF